MLSGLMVFTLAGLPTPRPALASSRRHGGGSCGGHNGTADGRRCGRGIASGGSTALFASPHYSGVRRLSA
ncbi:hypothetical protein MBOT_23000 [Mycobacterium botniense]|uniref:Uncharacterized protein n=1 Tax=Mycobacterium botniense TaxID=84962 RepID=A0A7I9XYR7_9MYCO|nr:hypothetical protein MBOT_23000 [Mycobacterium botniense]